MSIQVQEINKAFGDFHALKNVSLDIDSGELIALLGPSGSGKTTLLRIIAGLEFSDAGRVLFNQKDVTDVPAGKRRIGFVFQHYALFRHMTIFENVAFGLRVRPRSSRPDEEQIRERVLKLLRLVQLEGLEKRYPSQLSGGQRQRIALARALAVEPDVLLLDEPFGALDARVRKELRRWLRKLHQEIHVTTIFVTHDQEEALEIADRVVVMSQGVIEQVGTPQEVYDRPANPFVYQFLGNVNRVQGSAESGTVTIGEIKIPTPEIHTERPAKAVAYIRPHDIDIQRYRNGHSAIEVVVRHINAAGSLAKIELERIDTGETIEAEIDRAKHDDLRLEPGDNAFIRFRNQQIFVGDFSI
jgi:sulfate transport system ATP-binding protein